MAYQFRYSHASFLTFSNPRSATACPKTARARNRLCRLAKTFGSVDLDFEWGALASTLGRSQWLYGIVGGIELSKLTKLMAELHGTSCINFDQDVLTVDEGDVYQGHGRSQRPWVPIASGFMRGAFIALHHGVHCSRFDLM